MKRYVRAFLSTLLMLPMPLLIHYISIQFEKSTGSFPYGFTALSVAISIGMLVLNVVLWVSAIKDKDLKDL